MSAQMPSQAGLIDQLEETLGNKDLARRADVLRKVTDGLVAASIPSMFSAIEREVRKRQAAQPLET